MREHEKEIEKVLLNHEKDVNKKLLKTYEQSLMDINKKSKELQDRIDELVAASPENETLIRSKIYQLEYQKALKQQINRYMDVLKSEHVKDINDYMNIMYEDSYITQFYHLNKLGMPVTAPINQELLIKALTYKTEDIPLSKRIYDNVNKAKKDVLAEISRGISTGMSNQDIARNIQNRMNVSYRKARQLAQNEGHRVKTDARIDSMHAAKDKGADIVKVWDATLDNKTRPVHAELDQQHAEIDEPFKYSGGEVQAPKKFGIPALDINCRCILIAVPRWDVEDTIQKRDNITGELIEAKNYADWKKKYYNEVEKQDNTVNKVVKPVFDIKANTKKLKEAIKDDDYKEYLGMLENHQDENLKRMYTNYADKINGIKYKNGGGAYNPPSNTLVFGYETKYDEINKFSTLAHEYGHFFDYHINAKVHHKEIDALRSVTNGFLKKKVSSSDEFLEAVRKDKVYLKEILNREAMEHLKNHDGSAGVQDAIDGLFVKSRIKWGHGEAYYNRAYSAIKTLNWHKEVQNVYKGLGLDASSQVKVKNIMRQYEASSEMWANIMSAYICGGKELEFVKEYLPNSYKEMIKILKGVE